MRHAIARNIEVACPTVPLENALSIVDVESKVGKTDHRNIFLRPNLSIIGYDKNAESA